MLAVTAGNRYLEAALLLDETLDVDRVTPSAFRSADGYDVAIFDSFVPAEPPHTASFFLASHPAHGDFPFAVRGRVERPYFDTLARDDQLLRFTSLRDVNVARALLLQAHVDDQVVASFGKTPLIVRGKRDGVPLLALAFDVRESDLPLRVAWPLLLLQGIEQLAAAPGSSAAAPFAHVGTTGSASLAPRTVFIATPLRAKHPLPLVPSTDLWCWLIALAAALLVFEWCSYQRRWTV